MERKLAAAAEAHRKEIESAKWDAASQLEAARKDSSSKLAQAEEKLRGEMAALQTRCGCSLQSICLFRRTCSTL